MRRSRSLIVLVAVIALGGCGADSEAPINSDDQYGESCRTVRAQAKAAAETGIRLKGESSSDSAAIATSAQDYVTAVRSRPDCFSEGQKANAEQVGATLPSPSG